MLNCVSDMARTIEMNSTGLSKLLASFLGLISKFKGWGVYIVEFVKE